jgi:hypothetical protein
MDPFLVEVARNMDNYQSRDEIMRVMDELEYLFDALEDEQQDMCGQFLSVLEKRLAALDTRP